MGWKTSMIVCFITAAHGGGRVVRVSGSETSVSSSTPASAIIYDAYTSIIKRRIKNKKRNTKKSGHRLLPLFPKVGWCQAFALCIRSTTIF